MRPMTSPQKASTPARSGATGNEAPVDVASRARNAFLLGSLALLLGLGGLALGLAAYLRAPGSDTCRTAAWDSEPAASDLPAGWTVSTSQVGMNGLGVSLTGSAADQSTAAPTIFVTVSCYGPDAVGALDRSRARVQHAGETVTDRTDLGDGGYGLSDSSSGALAINFRRGALVAYAATSGSVAQQDLDTVASAFDAAMVRAIDGKAIPATARPSSAASASASASAGPSPSESAPGPSGSAGASPSVSANPSEGAGRSPSASPEAAPELVAMLPGEVAGTALTRDSAVGADVLGDDAVSRALTAALRGLGATAADLRVAQAYDDSGTVDLYLVAFAVKGVSATRIEPALLDTWLSARVAGVTTTTATIAGKQVTVVDYGDQGAKAYVRTTDTAVVIVQTKDPALAAEAIGLLP